MKITFFLDMGSNHAGLYKVWKEFEKRGYKLIDNKWEFPKEDLPNVQQSINDNEIDFVYLIEE